MKRLLLALPFLSLFLACPAYARDEGGDGPVMPSYSELVRMGYGPQQQSYTQPGQYAPSEGQLQGAYAFGSSYSNDEYYEIPKPTMAFHYRGVTIYYGYTPVTVTPWDARVRYAFGYPAEYFRKMTPVALNTQSLDQYAVAIPEQRIPGAAGTGDLIAHNAARDNAVTYVRPAPPQERTQSLAARKAAAAAKTASAAGSATSTGATAASSGTASALPPIGEKPPKQ